MQDADSHDKLSYVHDCVERGARKETNCTTHTFISPVGMLSCNDQAFEVPIVYQGRTL